MSNINKYAVVFDTNSYREFVRGKKDIISDIEKLKELEAKKNIQAYSHIIVGMEMLANLVEGEDGVNYNDCLNGIRAMSNHCYDGTAKAHELSLIFICILPNHFLIRHLKM